MLFIDFYKFCKNGIIPISSPVYVPPKSVWPCFPCSPDGAALGKSHLLPLSPLPERRNAVPPLWLDWTHRGGGTYRGCLEMPGNSLGRERGVMICAVDFDQWEEIGKDQWKNCSDFLHAMDYFEEQCSLSPLWRCFVWATNCIAH